MRRNKDTVVLHRILGAFALLVLTLPGYVVGSLVREIIYDLSHGYGLPTSGNVATILLNIVLFGGSAIGLVFLGAAAFLSFRAEPATEFRASLVFLALGIGVCLTAWFLSTVMLFFV